MKRFLFIILLSATSLQMFANKNFADQSILASGKWIKIATSLRGVHKITYDQLQNWGLTDPTMLSIYSNGGYMLPKMNATTYPDDLTKIPIYHTTDNDGKDCVFFYSTGTTEWTYNSSRSIYTHNLNLYSDKIYFYLSTDVEKSDAPEEVPSIELESEKSVSNFDDYQLYENEDLNLINSGRNWYSDRIMQSSSESFNFEFTNSIPSKPATLTIAAAAESSEESWYKISINDTEAKEIQFNGYTSSQEATHKEIDFTFDAANSIGIKINYDISGTTGDSWLDFIVINLKSKLIFNSEQLFFCNSESLNYGVLKYSIEVNTTDPELWDISNPLAPQKVNYSISSNTLTFKSEGYDIPKYVLFDVTQSDFPVPEFIEEVDNQNIHGEPNYDMLIVSHPDFIESSEKLATFHRKNDNLSVLVITTKEIYNEFSSGLPDVAAIRNMVKMFYDRSIDSETSLKYLLLMGDGSYDNRNFDGTNNNFIPTYQSENSLSETSSYLSDDFFVLLDNDEGEATGLIDVGVGRITCSTVTEAETVVNKTIDYTSTETFGDWRNIIAFLADDEDSNQHMKYTEGLVDIVNEKYPGLYPDKIYFDSYQQSSSSSGDTYPDVTDAINSRVDDGALILNYMGHANELSLAAEGVLGVNDISSWSNINKLPVFVTATCEFSRFDDDITTAGEQILLSSTGGGVALFSTTRLVYSGSNSRLSKNFYNYAFEQDQDGENLRMGDIMRLAKNATLNDGNNKRNFTLLGDPALQLAFPKYNIVTKTINGQSIDEDVTIGALDKVTITSEVVDHNGNLLTNYNGTVSTIVYDKEVTVETLANDDGTPFEYSEQNNIIYKGNASVNNGTFSITFVVPKDITYNIDKGKIYYYTSNDTADGNGATDQFNIGGTSNAPIIDYDSPEIELYLNNESFKSYDQVSTSALLLVNLYDESGINTVGTGIGHDIVATLDDDYSNPMVLNDYYSSEEGSYQEGSIVYPLNDMETGEHKIELKVWDVQNNSATKEIYFNVGDGFQIVSIFNKPNPVVTYTTFDISHNLPGDLFDTKIEIFNLKGIKIDEIDETTSSYGSTSTEITWNNFNARTINNNGLLIYRITMKNEEGLSATRAGKLIMKNN